jgi:glutathione-regulated potassium-efflux system protein KefB
MAAEGGGVELGAAVALLAAGVAAVPVFRRLRLGSVLGYLAAGVAVGPFGFGVLSDPEAALHIAELGVVLFLFLIGLEMRPAKLWALRGAIFGLGLAQVLTCVALLTGVAMLFGVAPVVAVIAASGFVLSSTAVIMQMMDERGETATPAGQRAVSILLLEDLAIVPLLALVALLASATGSQVDDGRPAWLSVAIAVATIAVVVGAGRWLLDPFFRLLAKSGAREVMTAAALLVVLGAALFMQWGGLSMAMGAFLAGVLLSESTFRHQLEADIEPFRGILLGLFFLSVGMSLDLAVVAATCRSFSVACCCSCWSRRWASMALPGCSGLDTGRLSSEAATFAQGGEFAFVLYGAALAAGLFDTAAAATMTAIVILSMALTPLLVIATYRLIPSETASLDGVDEADGCWGGCSSSASGASHRWSASRCWRTASTCRHRDRRGNDPGRGGFRVQGVLRRWNAARRAARLGRRGGRGHPGLRGQARDGGSHRGALPGGVPAGQALRPGLRPRPCAPACRGGRGVPNPRDL